MPVKHTIYTFSKPMIIILCASVKTYGIYGGIHEKVAKIFQTEVSIFLAKCVMFAIVSIVLTVNMRIDTWPILSSENAQQIYENFIEFKIILIKTLIEVGITLFCLLVLQWGWYSRIAGIIGGFLIPIYFLLKVISKESFLSNFDIASIWEILKQGFPFVIAQFLIIAFVSIDKFFIPQYFSKHELGLYGIAFQISNLLTIFAVSVISVLQPIQYRLATNLDFINKGKLLKLIYFFIGTQLIAGIVLIFMAPLLYRYFINIQYHESISWVKYLVLGAFLSSCTAFFMNVVRQKATGRQLIEINFYPLLLLIVLFFVLPKYFHIWGIFYAYIVVNIFILVLSVRRSVKVLEISNRTMAHVRISFKKVWNNFIE